MTEQLKTALAIIRRKQLEARTGLSRAAIYDRLNPKHSSYDPDFPRPISLGAPGMRNPPVGWLAHEVDAWIARCVSQSRQAA